MAEINYGGQAVIEGVMMAGPKGKAIACRNELGEIVYKIESKKSLGERYPQLKLPIIRGLVSFGVSMVSGIKDLTWSAAQAGQSEDDNLSGWDIFLAVSLAFILCAVLFVALPVFVATWLHPYVGDFGRSLVEGLLRVGLFIGYIVAISRMEDIRRLFSYHGAEHKTINAYEAGVELTPANVAKYSRIHTRCGTSFIFMAILLMIVVFTFVGQTTALLRILIKLLLLPVIAGVSYELFRLPLKYPNNMLVKALVSPGLALQRLTTREPSEDMLEVAIAALTSVPGFHGEEVSETTIEITTPKHKTTEENAAVEQQVAFDRQPNSIDQELSCNHHAEKTEQKNINTPQNHQKHETAHNIDKSHDNAAKARQFCGKVTDGMAIAYAVCASGLKTVGLSVSAAAKDFGQRVKPACKKAGTAISTTTQKVKGKVKPTCIKTGSAIKESTKEAADWLNKTGDKLNESVEQAKHNHQHPEQSHASDHFMSDYGEKTQKHSENHWQNHTVSDANSAAGTVEKQPISHDLIIDEEAGRQIISEKAAVMARLAAIEREVDERESAMKAEAKPAAPDAATEASSADYPAKPADNNKTSDENKQGANKQGANKQGGSKQGGSKQGGSKQGANKQGGSKQGANKQGGSKQGGNKQGGSKQGGSKQGGSKQGGSKQGGSKQGGSKQGGNKQGGNKQGGNKPSGGQTKQPN